MNEADERNIIQYVMQNSKPMDALYGSYRRYCKEMGLKLESEEHLERTLKSQGSQILTIDGKKYVYGVMFKGEKPTKKNPPYFNRPPVDEEVFCEWLANHGWTGM